MQERLARLTRAVIEEAAERGNAVILGRGAAFIIGRRRDALHVHLHAPLEARVRNLLTRARRSPRTRGRMRPRSPSCAGPSTRSGPSTSGGSSAWTGWTSRTTTWPSTRAAPRSPVAADLIELAVQATPRGRQVIADGPPPAQTRLPVGLRAFRHRNFRLFWAGQLISLIGTWMQTVAQSWLVFQLTHDPVALGLLAVQFAPVLVLGLFGGVVADAFPKRNALVATQAASLVLALVLGLLDLSGSVQVWQVFVLAGLLGIVSAFDMPIRQSFVVEMVGREDIANAVALNSAVFNGTRIVGPAIAGLLITTVGIAACFLINAASYVAVIVSLFLMRTRSAAASRLGPRAHLAVGGRAAGRRAALRARHAVDPASR